MIETLFRLGALMAALLVLAPAKAMSEEDRSFRSFLADVVGLSEAEMGEIVDGDVIVRTIDVESGRAIVVVGIMRLPATRDFLVQRMEDLSGYRNRQDVLAVGRVGDSPSSSDFAALRLPDDDLKSLRNCKVGSCDVKITQVALDQLHEQGNGSADPDPNAVVRDMLYHRAERYLSGGLGALEPMVDKKDPRQAESELETLLGQSKGLLDYAEKFQTYLHEYPNASLDDTTDLLYWSVEDFGMKPTASLKHVAIHFPAGSPSAFIVGQISLYASHYFDATQSILLWIEAEIEQEGSTGYVVWTERALFDGNVTGLKRKKLNGGLTDSLKNTLEKIRGKTEESHNESK